MTLVNAVAYNKVTVTIPFDDCVPIKMDPIQRTSFRSSPTVDRLPSQSGVLGVMSLSTRCKSCTHVRIRKMPPARSALLLPYVI